MKGYINMIFTVDKDEFEKAIIPVSIVAQNKSFIWRQRIINSCCIAMI